MATTQETYRLGTRYPRYTTKLNAFNAGMYLTNQVEPEGYVKRMVNYDIDATGSHIKPRKGRKVIQELDTSNNVHSFMFTDYLYCYEGEMVDDVFKFIEPKKVVGTVDVLLGDQGTGLVYNKSENEFKQTDFNESSFQPIRLMIGEDTIAFDKTLTWGTHKYLSTVVNNECLAIQGDYSNYEDVVVAPGVIENRPKRVLQKLNLGCYVNEEDKLNYKIEKEDLIIKELNPLEAANSGYNMLSETPYVFSDEATGSLAILGIMKYEPDDLDMSIPLLSPDLGKPVKLRVYHQYKSANTSIKYTVEMRNLNEYNSVFETIISNGTYTTGENNKWFITITPKYEYTQIRITATEGSDTTTTTSFVDSIMCNNEVLKSYTLKNIDLLNCKGMISWFGYLGVYGVNEAPDTIFFSDIENPGYFPFPNNAITFDNNILAVHNYLDYLLVITIDSIFLVSIGTNIMTSTQKRVMSNIHIPEVDAINLVVLKDQIFFKDATQFYVLKPNNYTSDATDLKNYVISTAIDNYTKNFTAETVKLLNEVYKTTNQKLTAHYQEEVKIEDFYLWEVYSYIINEDVHYIYSISPSYGSSTFGALYIGDIEVRPGHLDLHLVYNTLTRAWRIYLIPTKTGNLGLPPDYNYYVGGIGCNVLPTVWRNKDTGEYYEFINIAEIGDLESYKKYLEGEEHIDSTVRGKMSVVSISDESTTDNIPFNIGDITLQLSDHYDNYNYIDTGIIAIEDVFTKRWREVQFNILNSEPTMIPFYNSFILDGVERVHSTHYQLQHITDPDDPEYGKIYITPSEVDNLEVGNVLLHGTSTLAGEATDTDYWALDLSQFPELTMVTVRFSLQGRGRHASLKLLNTSLKRYELADINWVYRMMSAR